VYIQKYMLKGSGLKIQFVMIRRTFLLFAMDPQKLQRHLQHFLPRHLRQKLLVRLLSATAFPTGLTLSATIVPGMGLQPIVVEHLAIPLPVPMV
jgi:hypothetical protein